jgi:hypothetical protein
MSNKTQTYYFYEFLKILPAIALVIIIFYFSSLSNPYPTAPSKFTLLFLNPMLHICEFGALSFLLFFGLFPKVRTLFLIIISIFYAFLDELHQYFVPFRYFDIFDFFLDVVGVIGGLVFYLFVKFILTRIKSKD